jgi:hypothetical protein
MAVDRAQKVLDAIGIRVVTRVEIELLLADGLPLTSEKNRLRVLGMVTTWHQSSVAAGAKRLDC